MPTTTDLEDLVRHLSGRGAVGRSGASPLAEPDGDAAQVLDEVRRRTRALFDDPDDENPPSPRDRPQASPLVSKRGRRGLLTGLLLVVLGSALAFVLSQPWRLNNLPPVDRSDREIRLALAAIQARLAAPAPASASDPAIDALGRRLDARLAALEDRLGRSERPAKPEGTDAPRRAAAPDPALAAINDDIAAIRRELRGSEAATNGQIQAMRSLLDQVNTEVRKVLSRPEPSQSANIAPVLALAVQALVHNLQHPSAQVRGEAVEQLARLAPTSRTAIPALRDRYARESDPNVRTAIETALSILTSN